LLLCRSTWVSRGSLGLAFVADGQQFASGDGDSLVFLWKSNLADDFETRPETESGSQKSGQETETGSQKSRQETEAPGKTRDILEEKKSISDKENRSSGRQLPTNQPQKRTQDADILEQVGSQSSQSLVCRKSFCLFIVDCR
jgi:hypothetical protein